MDRIGLHSPTDIGAQIDYIYVESTDMCYEVYADGIVAACSNAVGLLTWYRMTEAEIDQLRNDAEGN